MKFRTMQTMPKCEGLEFSRFTQLYKWNPLTEQLEESELQDDQELIQSSADCELHSVLERFGYYPDELRVPDNPQYDAPVDMFPSVRANTTAYGDCKMTEVANAYGITREDLLKAQVEKGEVGILEKIQEILAKQIKDIKEDATNGNAKTQRPQGLSEHSGEDAPPQS